MRYKSLGISCLLSLMISFPAWAKSYEVKPGDNLWNIASRYTEGKVTTHQMIAAIHDLNSNKLGSSLDNIYAGMKLEIPSIEMASEAQSAKATNLLAGNPGVSSVDTAQAEAILLKINNIESEIHQVMSDIESSKAAFESGLNN